MHCALLAQLAVQAEFKVFGNMDWAGGHLANASEVLARQAVVPGGLAHLNPWSGPFEVWGCYGAGRRFSLAG